MGHVAVGAEGALVPFWSGPRSAGDGSPRDPPIRGGSRQNDDFRPFFPGPPRRTMVAEGSREIPEEVAYAETLQRYLILRVSGCGVVRVCEGRPSET